MLHYNSYESLSIAAAHFFTAECDRCIMKNNRFMVALSGGNTPKRLYELLASPSFSKNIDWKKVYIFFSDERYLPANNDASNFKMAATTLLDHVPVSRKNIFAIPTASTPAKDAAKYELDLKKIFGSRIPAFDLVLLGMGDDGHTASLFPDSEILKEKNRLIKEVYIKEKQAWRISFTLPLINHAKQILLLVSGKEKAPVLKKVMSKRKIKSLLPVQLIKGNILWMIS